MNLAVNNWDNGKNLLSFTCDVRNPGFTRIRWQQSKCGENMKFHTLTVLLGLILSGCQADPAKGRNYGNATVAQVVRVCDGDTFVANLSGYRPLVGEEIRIRIRGVNTPELKSPVPVDREKAFTAKTFLAKLLASGQKIELRNITRGKYFRIVADVYVNNQNIKQQIIAQGEK